MAQASAQQSVYHAVPSGPPAGFKSTRNLQAQAATATAQAQQKVVSQIPLVNHLPPLEVLSTFQDLEPYWTTLVNLLKERDMMSLAACLDARDLTVIPPGVLQLPYFGSVEKSFLERSRIDLEYWLRQTTGIGGLKLELVEMQSDVPQRLRPTSDRDKYGAMAAKNPALELLRQRLGMDFA